MVARVPPRCGLGQPDRAVPTRLNDGHPLQTLVVARIQRQRDKGVVQLRHANAT
jgi:hypothetical protein